MNFPASFVAEIKRWYGTKGEQWLKNLPQILQSCSDEWSLEIGEPMPNLTVTYVTHAKTADGAEVVLKLNPHTTHFMEMEVLECLKDHPGIVNLLYSSKDLAAMVLEKVDPGTSLREVQARSDEEATTLAAAVIRDVQADVPAQHNFRTVATEMEVIREMHEKGGWDKETMAMLSKALELQAELESTKTGDKLIHGDLHHDNILLDDKRGWLAIDPKGRVGDPVYNAARIMRNYWDLAPTEDIIQKRLDILAEVTGFDRWRIAAWAYLDCVLSESWDLDEIGHRDGKEKPIIALIETVVDAR